MMKAGIIGLWQFLHLEKVGTTTIIFFQDPRGRVFLKVSSILLTTVSNSFPSLVLSGISDQFLPGLRKKLPGQVRNSL